jgi:hypothetical protein
MSDLPANYTFGGEYDTWGIIFNSTDEVRSPNFGVGLAVKMKTGDPAFGSVNVDAVMIQIIFGFSRKCHDKNFSN